MNYNSNLIYQVEHKPLQALWRAICFLPWAWLTLLTIFTLAVTAHIGQFPSYSNPEPFILTGIYSFLHATVMYGIFALYVSIPLWSIAGVIIQRTTTYRFPKKYIALYLLGISVYIWLSVSNFAGIISWIWD